ARSARRGLRRQVDGRRRRVQPGIHRDAEHLLLERHLEPPRTSAQDALGAEPRHAVRAQQGARAQAAHPRRAQQRPHQGRDQGDLSPGRHLLRRARRGSRLPRGARGVSIRKIAFIGLGTMGQPMAANLAREGFAVQSYDRNGSGNYKSAREAAEGADVLITMLPDGDAVREAVLEALPSLRPGAVVIDMSSSDPTATRALVPALQAKGVKIIDAPVSGAIAKAKDGTLAIMIGGEAEVF